MLVNPDRAILKAIKKYDKNLYVKWNNSRKYFEVWYKNIKGDHLITPVMETIYKDTGKYGKFMPLDNRILEWLFLADTQRHNFNKNWKWSGKNKYFGNLNKRRRDSFRECRNTSAELFTLFRNEKAAVRHEQKEYVRPDLQFKTSNRLFSRSKENIKKAKEAGQ